MEPWNHAVGMTPINQRAGVLQERALARRVLHFTAHGLAWECGRLSGFENLQLEHNHLIEGSLSYIKQGFTEYQQPFAPERRTLADVREGVV